MEFENETPSIQEDEDPKAEGPQLERAEVIEVTAARLHDCKVDVEQGIRCPEGVEVNIEVKQGNWTFRGENPQAILISGNYPTLFYFLQAKLTTNEVFARLPAADKRDAVIGLIELARKLNPGYNLDDFASYKDESLLLPTQVDMTPAFAKAYEQGSEGTRRLEELALSDGFKITDPTAQENIYRDSAANAIPIPENPHYRRKDNNGESPNQLYPEVIERLGRMAEEFSTLEFGGVTGWGLVYTDALRDLNLQEKTYQTKGLVSTYKSTGHTTGYAVDVSIGRVTHPTRGEVTYSDFSGPGKPVPSKEWAPIIEKMWPEMERLALKHGFVVYKEGDHLHLYAPKERKLEGLFESDQEDHEIMARASSM